MDAYRAKLTSDSAREGAMQVSGATVRGILVAYFPGRKYNQTPLPDEVIVRLTQGATDVPAQKVSEKMGAEKRALMEAAAAAIAVQAGAEIKISVKKLPAEVKVGAGDKPRVVAGLPVRVAGLTYALYKGKQNGDLITTYAAALLQIEGTPVDAATKTPLPLPEITRETPETLWPSFGALLDNREAKPSDTIPIAITPTDVPQDWLQWRKEESDPLQCVLGKGGYFPFTIVLGERAVTVNAPLYKEDVAQAFGVTNVATWTQGTAVALLKFARGALYGAVHVKRSQEMLENVEVEGAFKSLRAARVTLWIDLPHTIRAAGTKVDEAWVKEAVFMGETSVESPYHTNNPHSVSFKLTGKAPAVNVTEYDGRLSSFKGCEFWKVGNAVFALPGAAGEEVHAKKRSKKE